ncbi:MAG: hypothetical protein LBE09_06105 [Christensenellaceae bacterium]|nr:hypothetical protein [Christensenellaceae bacterium]
MVLNSDEAGVALMSLSKSSYSMPITLHPKWYENCYKLQFGANANSASLSGDSGIGGAHGGKWTTMWIYLSFEGSSGVADSYGLGEQGSSGDKGADGRVPSAIGKW